jgi:ketosteroid isomerase-like protein
MSQQNEEIVRSAFPGVGERSLDETAEAFWHSEITYVEDPTWPGASTYRGRDAVLRCFKGYTESLGREEDFVVTVERVFDAGARQVPIVRFQSMASTSGVPHEHLWAFVVEIKEGRVIYLRAYYEPTDALEAVGLSE